MPAILALGATAAVTFASAASAGQLVRETFHEQGTFVLEDFCDVPATHSGRPGSSATVGSSYEVLVRPPTYRHAVMSVASRAVTATGARL